MTTPTYTCESCGGTFEQGWSDEDARAERQQNWGDLPDDAFALVCNDCHEKIARPWLDLPFLYLADEMEELALKHGSQPLRAAALVLRETKSIEAASDALDKAIVDTFVEGFVAHMIEKVVALNPQTVAACFRSPTTSKRYKKRIAKKKFARLEA